MAIDAGANAIRRSAVRGALVALHFGLLLLPGQASAEGSRATFQVNISLSPPPSVCATQSLTGRAGASARVTCLTSGLPNFSTPGRPDFVAVGIGAASSAPGTGSYAPGAGRSVETASRTPSTANVDSLGATASVPARTEDGATEASAAGSESGAERNLRGADFRSDRVSAPPQEIEVAF